MKRLMAALAIVAGSIAPVTGESSIDPAFGLWYSENKGAIIEIGLCGDHACGEMVWLKNPTDESGAPKLDAQGNPLCGLVLVRGFEREDAGSWKDGEIYNPRDGKKYAALMQIRADDELEVRGYAGLRLFGKSQIWTRADSDQGGC